MSFYSKQKYFCNCCGRELYCALVNNRTFMGREFKVCSPACIREMRWRQTLSIMGTEYYPDPEPYDGET